MPAKKLGWQRETTASFVIRENGRVENTRIVRTSGHGLLDGNVLDTIREVQPFPKPPVKAEFVIPVLYSLE